MRLVCIVSVFLFSFATDRVAAEHIQVTDDRGRTVQLNTPAQRIVSLGPSMTELLFTMGAGSQIIAVDQASDYPAEVNAKRKIPGGLRLDLEAIVAQRPDLIIIWDSGYQSVALERLSPAIPIYYSEPVSLADIATTLQKFGVLTGHERAARDAAYRFTQHLASLKQHYAGRKTLRGFYELWNTPLMSVGSAHIISDAMQICGVNNIFDDSTVLVPHVEIETVLQRTPQVIITTMSKDTDSVTVFWRKWFGQVMPPVVEVNDTLMSRHSIRIVDGIKQLCQQVDVLRPH